MSAKFLLGLGHHTNNFAYELLCTGSLFCLPLLQGFSERPASGGIMARAMQYVETRAWK